MGRNTRASHEHDSTQTKTQSHCWLLQCCLCLLLLLVAASKQACWHHAGVSRHSSTRGSRMSPHCYHSSVAALYLLLLAFFACERSPLLTKIKSEKIPICCDFKLHNLNNLVCANKNRIHPICKFEFDARYNFSPNYNHQIKLIKKFINKLKLSRKPS